MTMSPDGATVTELHAAEGVLLDLPAQGNAPGKTIKASTLAATGEAGAGLQTATFEGPVDYRESRAARGAQAAVDRHATARRLIVHTKPGPRRPPAGGVPRQRQVRRRHAVDGRSTDRRVPGRPGSAGPRRPRRPSPDRRRPSPTPSSPSHARTISLTMGTQVLQAETDVRSIMERKADTGRGRAGRKTASARRADEAALAAQAGSAGHGPVEPARVRWERVARRLFGRGPAVADRRHRAAGGHHRNRRQVRQPHRPPQGPHEDAARRRRSENEQRNVHRDDRHVGRLRLRGRQAPGDLHVHRHGAGPPGRSRRGTSPASGSTCSSRRGPTSWNASKGTGGDDHRDRPHGARAAPHLHVGGRDLRDGGVAGRSRAEVGRRPARRRWPRSCGSSAPSTTFRPKAAR